MAKIAYTISLFFIVFCAFAQDQQYLDSLYRAMENPRHDTQKIEILNNLADALKYYDPETALKHAKEAALLSRTLDYPKGMALSSYNVGVNYLTLGEANKAEDSFVHSLAIFKKLNDQKGIADNYNFLGRIYEVKGIYDKAINYYIKSLRIREKIMDEIGIASTLNSIGLIYFHQRNYKKAIQSFNNALEIVEKLDNNIGIASTLNNMAALYEKIDSTELAMESYLRVLEIDKQSGNKYGIASSLNNVGTMYHKMQEYTKAMQYYKEALAINKELDNKYGMTNALMNIGVIYELKQKYTLAVNYINQSLVLAREQGFIELEKNAYDELSYIYKELGDYRSAYEYEISYSKLRDSLQDEKNKKIIAEMDEKYQAEKREKEIQLLKKDQELKDAEIAKKNAKVKQQRTQMIALFAGILLLVILAVVVLRAYRQKRQANILLEAQNKQIREQKDIIEEKNRNIMDSIKYAQRIQEAILPPDKVVKETLEKSFVMFKPKDIVSGDFYWMDNKNGVVFFSAVDCTGHGVPGAFMSIVGHNGLNQAIKEYGLVKPAEILDQLNLLVEDTLHQKNKSEVKDGMDLALCAVDFNQNLLEYAGANNPLYFIRKKGKRLRSAENGEIKPALENETYALFEIKADKQPIGAYDGRKNFTNHTIELMPGDGIYVFSDGFADQFGGKDGKKFKYKPFKKLLLDIFEEPMSRQKSRLNDTIENWKGSIEQVDDICIIGVKI